MQGLKLPDSPCLISGKKTKTMAKAFRLCYRPDGSHVRPPKPQWLLNCEASGRSKVSTTYWTKLYWATPPWLNEQQLNQMKEIYLKAGEKHVDHIVPLKSNLVCGLHVPWNLQILEPKSNLAKSNSWWPFHPYETLCMIGEYEPQQLRLV